MSNNKKVYVGRSINAILVYWSADEYPDTDKLTDAAKKGLVHFYLPDHDSIGSIYVVCSASELTQDEVDQVYRQLEDE